MNEQDLRDCFAMFASVGLLLKHGDGYVAKIAEKSYEVADAMLEARKPKEVGIKAVRKVRKANDQEN
jgi:hypothetical protein